MGVGGGVRRGLFKREDGKLALCQGSNTNESPTHTVIETLVGLEPRATAKTYLRFPHGTH